MESRWSPYWTEHYHNRDIRFFVLFLERVPRPFDKSRSPPDVSISVAIIRKWKLTSYGHRNYIKYKQEGWLSSLLFRFIASLEMEGTEIVLQIMFLMVIQGF